MSYKRKEAEGGGKVGEREEGKEEEGEEKNNEGRMEGGGLGGKCNGRKSVLDGTHRVKMQQFAECFCLIVGFKERTNLFVENKQHEST